MATDTLTLRVEERGAKLTARDVAGVGDEVDKTGKRSRKANKDLNIFSRTVQFLGVRAVIATGAVLVLSVAMLALAPQIAATTAAMFSLAAIIAPIALLAAGAMMIFKDTVDEAGSSAAQLKDMVFQLKHAFRVMVAPGAAAVFRGLAKAMEILLPVMESLRPAFTQFGEVIAQAFVIIAQGLADNGTALSTFILSLGPVLLQVARMTGPLIQGFLMVAQIGLPMLSTLLGLLEDFLLWFTRAIPNVMSFNAVGDELGGVMSDVWRIFQGLFDAMKPWLPFIGTALVGAWTALKEVIKFTADNMEIIGPLIVAMTTAWAAYRTVMLISVALTRAWAAISLIGTVMALIPAITSFKDAWILLDMAMAANPIGIVIAALAALAVGIIYAYKHSEKFRNIVNGLGAAIKEGLGAAIDWLVPKIEWLIGKLKWIFDHSPQGILAKGAFGLAKKGASLLGLADGTPSVTRAGSFVVGERGPEVVHLPAGAAVSPNGGGGGDVYAHVTLVMPDGEVLARQTVKAARKAQSVR